MRGLNFSDEMALQWFLPLHSSMHVPELQGIYTNSYPLIGSYENFDEASILVNKTQRCPETIFYKFKALLQEHTGQCMGGHRYLFTLFYAQHTMA